MSRIGERIRALIPSERGEQKALAHAAGLRPETLNKILTGATKEPGFETVVRIAKARGIPLDNLYEGDLPEPRSLLPAISAIDRKHAREFVTWLTEVFDLQGDADRLTSVHQESALLNSGRIDVPEDSAAIEAGGASSSNSHAPTPARRTVASSSAKARGKR